MTPEEQKARVVFFQERFYPGWPWWLIPLIAVILFVVTSTVVVRARISHSDHDKTVANILVGAWTLGPPIWFFIEYFIMPYRSPDQLPDIEAFKYTQELSSKVWVAGVIVLIALLRGKLSGVD